MKNVYYFQGEHRWLSNFFPVPIRFEGNHFPSVENAYQAAKFSQSHERIKFEICAPSTAKHWGKKATLRSTWNEERVALMKFLVTQKFTDPEFADLLRSLPQYCAIIEGNKWGDNFWGAVYNSTTGQFEGENNLGKIIMDIRDRLHAGTFPITEEFI